MSQIISQPADAGDTDPRTPRRVRHETRRRQLEVRAVTRITPHMVRVTLGGADLEGFNSPSFDDHVKLFFPEPSATPLAPDAELKLAGRNYTPRRHDAAAGTLDIDFALHQAGPATRWAEQAAPGQMLAVGGPRGSFIIPTAYDWHLLMGDDTALPAVARRLEELPAGARAVVIVEVDDAADQIAFSTKAEAAVHWIHRNGPAAGANDLMATKLASLELPKGEYYAWVACESLAAKALRAQLIADHGANPKWIRAAAYWRRGAADVHETFND